MENILPVSPNGWKRDAFPNALSHALDLVMGVFWRKVEIFYTRENKCLSLDTPHGQLKVLVIWFLVGAVR